ncbi:MAG: hypothetical protein JJU28_08475 [Cyclobacteriaceae bacterium]|nr:hypothetical protein [Cyclobacteriaceae bacterium]
MYKDFHMSRSSIPYQTVSVPLDGTKTNSLLLVFCGSVLLILLAFNPFLVSVGLAFTLYLFLNYIDKLGKTIPILELMLLMAALQWILGAYIAYQLEYEHWKYFMYVEFERYFAFVVPGLLAFAIGIFLFAPSYSLTSINKKLEELIEKMPKLPFMLIALGFIGPIIFSFLPATFRFVAYLLSNVMYAGVALLLFKKNSKNKWLIFGAIMALTFINSIAKGLFHDLLLWTALLGSFVFVQWQLSFVKKLSLFLIGILFAFSIQSIKSEYRTAAFITNSTSGQLSLFFSLIADRLTNPAEFLGDSFLGDSNVRLNQGWIISAILDHVPVVEPFADGETIKTAFSEALLPRFLAPDKKLAGGQENFKRFTGLYLTRKTSMGTSIIGEAYANFGESGAWLFMFIWGILLGLIFKLLIKKTFHRPILMVFIPLIFLQVIKSETELYVVLNHLVKSLIFVFLFLWAARKFLKWPV